MKPLVLFGNSGFAKIIDTLLQEAGEYEVVAFTCDRKYCQSQTFLNRPLVPFEELEAHYPPSAVEAMIAVGYSKMNTIRQAKYLVLKERGYKLASYFSPQLKVSKSVTFGEHVLVLDANCIQPFAEIGNNVIIWSDNVIGHDTKIGDHCFITSGAILSGFMELGEGSFVGPNTVLGTSVKLGQRVFVGPMAHVQENLPDEAVITAPKSSVRKVKSSRLPSF